MKKLCVIVIIICICSIYSAHCQSIGLRANTEFSKNREMNNAFGGGLYFEMDDSLQKFGFISFGDYLNKKGTFNDCIDCPTKEIYTSYQNISFEISGFLIKNISSSAKFKIGALVNYSMTNANRQGQIANWIETFKIKSVGIGPLLTLQFQEVLKLPLNFNLFVYPTYLINIKNETNPTGIISDYTNDLTLLNLQIGLAYIIKTEKLRYGQTEKESTKR